MKFKNLVQKAKQSSKNRRNALLTPKMYSTTNGLLWLHQEKLGLHQRKLGLRSCYSCSRMEQTMCHTHMKSPKKASQTAHQEVAMSQHACTRESKPVFHLQYCIDRSCSQPCHRFIGTHNTCHCDHKRVSSVCLTAEIRSIP